jgi:hypothetical protein
MYQDRIGTGGNGCFQKRQASGDACNQQSDPRFTFHLQPVRAIIREAFRFQ